MTITLDGVGDVAEENSRGDVKDGRPRRSIGDMRWNRFLAILLGLIGVLVTGITVMLLQLTGGSQETSVGSAPVAATPLTPSDQAMATPS